jgi:hypothetical protein
MATDMNSVEIIAINPRYSRSGVQYALADKDFRRKTKAWRGTKLYAIASGFGGHPNRLSIRS